MRHRKPVLRAAVAAMLSCVMLAGLATAALAAPFVPTPIPNYGINGFRLTLGDPGVRTDKVYSLPLAVGDYAYANVESGVAGGGFLYGAMGPGATETLPSAEMTSSETAIIWFGADVAGTYFVDIACEPTATAKTFDLFMYRARSQVKYATPSTFITPYNTARTISASIAEYYAEPGTIIPDTPVNVSRSDDNVNWVKVGSTRSDFNGVAKWSVREKRRAYYRFEVVEDPEFWVAPKIGSVRKVMPRALLTRPSAPTSIKHGVTFASVGYLNPRHTPGTAPVSVKAYRWTGKSWKYVYAFKGKAYDYRGNTKYVAKVNIARAGKWRLHAEHQDSKHALTKSTYRYIAIK